MITLIQQRPTQTRNRRRRRSGGTLLEFIIVLPILLIMLAAVVEFGLWLSNTQYLEMASREGASVASRFPTLPQNNGDTFPAAIRDAVDAELAKRGLPQAREIRLENNSGGTVVVTRDKLNGADPDCPEPTDEPASPTMTAGSSYVRVTVCLDTTSLTPNLLKTFGFDLDGRVTQQTTTRRYAP